jgi:hypothetical protein
MTKKRRTRREWIPAERAELYRALDFHGIAMGELVGTFGR